jgi:hypothetical protein
MYSCYSEKINLPEKESHRTVSLTKIDTIKSIYEQLGIPKKDCIRTVESVFDII